MQYVTDTPTKDMSLREMILTIKDWVKYLFSKWYIILIIGILGAAVGYWLVRDKMPVYSATTTFVLETGNQNGGMGQYAGLAAMAGIDLGGSGGGLFQGENILELYKSRSMISKTLLSTAIFDGKSQLLLDRYIDFNHLREKWAKNSQLRNIQFSLFNKYTDEKQQTLHDSIISVIVKNISKDYLIVGKPDKRLNIINVTVKAEDELFAKAFNEGIVQTVNDFYLLTKTQKSVENVAILQQKADSINAVMTGAIYRAASVADATPNLNPTRQTQREAPIQTAKASAEVNKAILGELVRNLELSKIALRKDAPLIQVVDTPVLPLDKEVIGKLKTILIGAILGGLLAIVILLLLKGFNQLMKIESKKKPVIL